ncbi:hypothetical protein [Streptococcus oriscaviae]|uniref:GAP family protein n=2 Tax=Streptococcus TaxID=1301 RepID=A0ABX7YNY9_9STRE|nr:hypothetical protein [Streptococcus oriscaviae]QUE55433.1 hypothetical protein INT76_08595 [Streptococcus oriscaviae]
MANLVTVLGLGLAGIDPVGMLMLMAQLAAGGSKRQAVLFAGLVLFGTTLLGVALSTLLGSSLNKLSDFIGEVGTAINQLPDASWIWIDVALIALLIYWGIRRDNQKEIKENQSEKKITGIWAGVVFMVFTALTDPSFLAVLAISGHRNHFLLSLLYSTIWVLLSQAPLFLLTIAVIFNQHEKFVLEFNAFMDKYRPILNRGLTGLIYILAGVFTLDLALYLLAGSWLLA